jgi:hypothetical protein
MQCVSFKIGAYYCLGGFGLQMVKFLKFSYSTERVDAHWLSWFGGDRKRKRIAIKERKSEIKKTPWF